MQAICVADSGSAGVKLTPWWLPTNCVQVAAAVVEHELVLRALGLPLQQRHEVEPVQAPATVGADDWKWV